MRFRIAVSLQACRRIAILLAALVPLQNPRADVVYVANYNNDSIGRFDLATGANLGAFVTTGLRQPDGLAFDSFGNLFVSNYGNNSIVKITPGGVQSIFASHTTDANIFAPQGLAFDSAGNLFVANWFGNTIEKFTPQGVGSIFASGLNYPADLAFDSSGNLYCANTGDSTILKFTSDGTRSVFATSSGYFDPLGIAFDGAGNLFVANINSHDIEKFTPAGVRSVFAANLPAPVSLLFDRFGNLLLASEASSASDPLNKIERFAADGTYLGVFAQAGLSSPFDIAIQVPEPSAVAFTVFGIFALVIRRRKVQRSVPL